MSGPTNLRPKKIGVKNILGSKKILGEKNGGKMNRPNKDLGSQKNIWVQTKLGPKKIGPEKSFESEKILGRKILEIINKLMNFFMNHGSNPPKYIPYDNRKAYFDNLNCVGKVINQLTFCSSITSSI